MGFMGKTFFDGFKDVWVKKREADIQKNMQEQLINIETQSFCRQNPDNKKYAR